MGLSVALISKNEGKNIERTLEGISEIADEIILIDSFSSDDTVNIAERFHCKIFQEEWKGFVEQKNSALEKCSMDWILFVDCDEVATPELRESIKHILNNHSSQIAGYFINRRSIYLGKIMKHSWQPDWKLRLVKKDANPKWIGTEVHEELVIQGDTNKIKGELLHYSFPDLSTQYKKTIEYAKLSAKKYNNQNREFHFASLLFNPISAFNKMYFFKLGFLDGIRGFLAAFSSLLGTFLKYAFLYEIKKELEK
ncbi:MAG TPA: glycosyltransferase family 2 protein [Candidatus Kapabacteria bacterium]|nr:glycosyltransferase family 2 protein [Candidatus Kapabacteria bacterium]